MVKRLFSLLVLAVTLSVLVLAAGVLAQDDATEVVPPALLTDPFLQLPTEDGVYVVWFTEWQGQSHSVTVDGTTFEAQSMKLSRMFEDFNSWHMDFEYDGLVARDIWRHEAYVDGLTSGERLPYFVTSIADDGTAVSSAEFTLSPLPAPGQPLRILMTSDHQMMSMTPANLEMVERIVGQVDAVFFAGDLVNVPDRASEWFDWGGGNALFAGLQGRGFTELERTQEADGVTTTTLRTYRGGELIQHAPLFPVIGNHEVMGRFNPGIDLDTQYNTPRPRWAAEARYEEVADLVNPTGDPAIREQWIEDNSFNSLSYEEIFTLPADGPAGEQYYAIQFGDVYLIGLYATRIWRTPVMGDTALGKYREPLNALNTPDNWGYGEFIFEDISEGSEQYEWLVAQLNSEGFQNARYRYVMMHQPIYGLGGNSIPAYVDPVQIIDYNEDGSIAAVRYEYPTDADIFINQIEPLLAEAGVDIVQWGHSHLWNRFVSADGVHYIETSNVGNNYGCFYEGYATRRHFPRDGQFNADSRFDQANYPLTGDPHGLEPVFPSEFAPMQDDEGNDLPCVASNDLTVFSIFDTEAGTVSSYVYDTRDPESEPMLFDVFSISE